MRGQPGDDGIFTLRGRLFSSGTVGHNPRSVRKADDKDIILGRPLDFHAVSSCLVQFLCVHVVIGSTRGGHYSSLLCATGSAPTYVLCYFPNLLFLMASLTWSS